MTHVAMGFVSAVGHLSCTAAVAPRRVVATKQGFRRRVPRHTVRVDAAFVSSGVTRTELQEKGGRAVVDIGGGKILIQEFMGDLYAVSNKCPHLGLSMQGRTKLLSADMRDDGCLVCPAHGSAFELTSGEPRGEWCPGLPTLPIVGKPLVGTPAPIPTYDVRLGAGQMIEVDVSSPRKASEIGAKKESGSSSAGEKSQNTETTNETTENETANETAENETANEPTDYQSPGSSGEDIGTLSRQELASLNKTPFADLNVSESVVGAEGVPDAIILAERKSKPLRKWRLGSYVAASMVGAAQMVSVVQLGVTQWPEFLEEAPLQILTDVMVIVSGSLLWRQELKNRAESLRVIWQKARQREESLTRAEAGLGDTLWTSRMRKNLKMPGGLGGTMGDGNGGEEKNE
jgi:nitrite reductase/ring-hydroxylating ferredoxin subunit|tara:strand:+ start:2002 stop:3210 length:1209 start_codon:yes stop_codon:yes gene_type:complete